MMLARLGLHELMVRKALGVRTVVVGSLRVLWAVCVQCAWF